MSRIKDLFIPHEGNNHHPHALRHHVLAGYSAMLIGIKVLAVFLPIALPWSTLFSSAVTPKNIIALTNQAREGQGLEALKMNALLSHAAQAKAEDMLTQQYFSHQSPQGMRAWDFIRQTGYQYLYSGENLAVHYSSAEDVEGGWMMSPTHRANVLNPRFEEIGVGVSYGAFEGTSTLFVVQMFGTPVVAEARDVKVLTQNLVKSAPVKSRPANIAVSEPVTNVTTTEAVLGVTESESVAVVPSVRADQLDIFREGTFVGGDDPYQDGIRLIYLFAIIFLTGILLLYIARQTHVQKVSVLAHTMCVIGFAVCLALV